MRSFVPLDPAAHLLDAYQRNARPRKRLSQSTGIPEWKITRIMKGEVSPTLEEAARLGAGLGLKLAYINTTPLSQNDMYWIGVRMDQERDQRADRLRRYFPDVTT